MFDCEGVGWGELDNSPSSNKASVSLSNQCCSLTDVDGRDEAEEGGGVSLDRLSRSSQLRSLGEGVVLMGGGASLEGAEGVNESPNGSDGVIRSIWFNPCCRLFNSNSKSNKSAMACKYVVLIKLENFTLLGVMSWNLHSYVNSKIQECTIL